MTLTLKNVLMCSVRRVFKEFFFKFKILTLKKLEIQKSEKQFFLIATEGLRPNLNTLSLFVTDLCRAETNRQESKKTNKQTT